MWQVYWVGPLAAGLLTSAFYRFVFGLPPVHQSPPQEIDQGVPLTGVRDGGTEETNMKWNYHFYHDDQYDTTNVVFIRNYDFTEVTFLHFLHLSYSAITKYILDITNLHVFVFHFDCFLLNSEVSIKLVLYMSWTIMYMSEYFLCCFEAFCIYYQNCKAMFLGSQV